MTDTFLYLSAVLLPDYIPSETKHKAITIPSVNINSCSILTATNKVIISGHIVFIDPAQDIIMPYITHKCPPIVMITLSNVIRNKTTGAVTVVSDVFKHAFLMDNIQFVSSANRSFTVDVKLISSHALVFNTKHQYSNHDINWSALNISDTLSGICAPYTEMTGYEPKFISSDDVFGVPSSSIKRRYATATDTTITEAIHDVVCSAYEPAKDESLISVDTYTSAVGDTVATKLVGYTIDITNNSPSFFRINTDPKYSIPLVDTEYAKSTIYLRFNGTPDADNQSATVALPLNSSYTSLIKDFNINERFVQYDQAHNIIMVNTIPNKFATTCATYLSEDNSVLSDQKSLYTKSTAVNASTPPTMPINKPLYTVNALQGFIQTNSYLGCNSIKPKYDTLIREVLTNNIIYLNVSNSVGHKVGQVIDLIVNEFGPNDAAQNYALNLAFSGKWQIVACNWELQNSAKSMLVNETLSLTRFGMLTSSVANPNQEYVIHK